MALNNLKSELVKKGIKQYEAAEFLGMTANNFNRKLSEAVPFTRDEMFALRSEYFPTRTLDYLFQSDGDTPTKAESLHAQVDAIGDALRQACGDDPEVDEIEVLFHEAVGEWERQAGK